SEPRARLLRQPAIVALLSSKLNELPEKMQGDPTIKKTRKKLEELEKAVSFPRETTPSVEEVRRIHELSAEMCKEISKKAPK
nr:hypothetical protein [Verrucomicrobiota bacterium]